MFDHQDVEPGVLGDSVRLQMNKLRPEQVLISGAFGLISLRVSVGDTASPRKPTTLAAGATGPSYSWPTRVCLYHRP